MEQSNIEQLPNPQQPKSSNIYKIFTTYSFVMLLFSMILITILIVGGWKSCQPQFNFSAIIPFCRMYFLIILPIISFLNLIAWFIGSRKRLRGTGFSIATTLLGPVSTLIFFIMDSLQVTC